MSLTRRLFLRNTAIVGAVGTSIAAPASETRLSPQARIDALAAELAEAMKAIYPDVNYYQVDHDLGLVIVSRGMRRGIKVEAKS